MAKLVSATYGDALFELAVDLNRVNEFYEEANGVLEAFTNNEDLNEFLNHPKISKEEKIQVVETVFAASVSQEITGLLVTIIDKARTNEIINIFNYFIGKIKEYKGIGTAYVTTAVDISDDLKEEIRQKLLATTGYQEIEMIFHVDSELIGGLVIRIGDRVIDSSIKNQMNKISKELLSLDVANQ